MRTLALMLLLFCGTRLLADETGYAIASVLRWDKERIDLGKVKKEGPQLLRFACRNTGDKPVSVLEVKTDCACGSLQAEAKAIAPGARWELKLSFDSTGRYGEQEHHVLVQTDEPLLHILSFTADVIENVTLRPRLLYWKRGDKPEQKGSVLRLRDITPAAQPQVSCSSKDFTATVEKLPEAMTWKLLIKPTNTERITQAVITVRIPAEGGPVEKALYVAIK